VPLIVHTAIAGFDDADALVISRKHNDKLAEEGYQGGHRGVGRYFSPSAKLQKTRMQQCRFKLEDETDAQWRKVSDLYTREMRESYRNHPLARTTLLSWQRVVILSRETEAPRALRTVLAQFILPTLGAEYVGEL
jgi:hypothetical protein